MIFEENIRSNKETFLKKVKTICLALEVEVEWLMIKMMIESALDHTATNPNGGATGLIGFMPSTAIGLGTTTAKLRAMSNIDQLDYVYKYYRGFRGMLKNYFDLSLVTFFQVAIGKPDDWVFHSSDLSAETIVKYNPTFDLNHDGMITIAEYKRYEISRLPELALKYILEKKKDG